MAFSFECPHCSQAFEADVEFCGSTCNCPNCGLLFVVPAVGAAVSGGDASLELEAGKEEILRLKDELLEAVHQRAVFEEELAQERRSALERGLQGEALAQVTASELAQLRAEFEKTCVAKAEFEKAAAEESARAKARISQLERDCEIALKRAEQTDAGTKSLALEVDRLARELSDKERAFNESNQKADRQLLEADKERDAAVLRSEELEREQGILRAKVEELSKKVVAEIGSQPKESNLGLERLLEARELELKKLSEQLAHATEANRALHDVSGAAGMGGEGRFFGKGAPVLFLTLAAGIVAGVSFSRLVAPSTSFSIPVSGVDPVESLVSEASSSKHSKEGGVDSGAAKETENVGTKSGSEGGGTMSAASGVSAIGASAPALQAGSVGFGSGMPGRLPDSFLGIRFGASTSELAGRGQWQETAGKRYRKAELFGVPVEAVLNSDEEGRLIMGSYVRVVDRHPSAVAPFLEWAVNSQDAVSALYGEPSNIHQVEDAADAAGVTKKIASGEDFYEAVWEREGEDTLINLSIRLFMEQKVIFRLEYRSRELAAAFAQRQAAKADATPEKATAKPEEQPPK